MVNTIYSLCSSSSARFDTWSLQPILGLTICLLVWLGDRQIIYHTIGPWMSKLQPKLTAPLHHCVWYTISLLVYLVDRKIRHIGFLTWKTLWRQSICEQTLRQNNPSVSFGLTEALRCALNRRATLIIWPFKKWLAGCPALLLRSEAI